MGAINYEKSGVNRDLADRLVGQIARDSKRTQNSRVKASIGGYASLYQLSRDQWLAASTDGVGTKLKLAFELNRHDTIGIDLVAMSVNDLLCVGAAPLFFLDYFATGKLDAKTARSVIQGIVEGCRQARCALVGGETAEMPGFYAPGEYDLAGFAVGALHPRQALPRKDIRAGDALIGLASSGFHSNGYSLLRKLLTQGKNRRKWALELLTPTQIYVDCLSRPLKLGWVKALAHITGSGFLNLPRVSEKFSYELHLPPLQERAPVFEWVERVSGLGFGELCSTFNQGIGMIAVCSPRHAAPMLRALKAQGQTAWKIGTVIPKRGRTKSEVFIQDAGKSARLLY